MVSVKRHACDNYDLVEQGRLDLNVDSEPMMGDVIIEDSYGPLTMVDLMTHSAGFEDDPIGFFYADSLENDLAPAEYLNRFAPRRVRPPGEQRVYSNYGEDLAGKVIEAVSGEHFADYMDANIFKPLGMAHSSFRDYPKENREPTCVLSPRSHFQHPLPRRHQVW